MLLTQVNVRFHMGETGFTWEKYGNIRQCLPQDNWLKYLLSEQKKSQEIYKGQHCCG